MKNRPMCLLATVLVLAVFLAGRWGLSWIWRGPGSARLEQMARDGTPAAAWGIVEKREEKTYTTYLTIKNASLTVQSVKYPVRKLKCEVEAGESYEPGQAVCLQGTLALPEEPGNPGEFHRLRYERARKIDYYLEDTSLLEKGEEYSPFRKMLAQTRESCLGLLRRILPRREAGILGAMLLGDKSGVEQEVKDWYQYAGISHVMAISGLHITLLGMGIWKLLGFFRIPMVPSALAGILALAVYGIWIGSGASALRAILMFTVLMGARVTGRSYDLLSALSLAAVLLLLDNPDVVYDSGFQLSFTAVLGVGAVAPVFQKKEGKGLMGRICKALRPGVILWLTTLPVVLAAFSQVSLAGIFWNLLVIPLVPAILVSGIAAMAVGAFHVGAGSVAGIPAWALLKLYEFTGQVTEKMPAGMWTPGQPQWWRILLYYLLGGILLAEAVYRKRKERQEKIQIKLQNKPQKKPQKKPQEKGGETGGASYRGRGRALWRTAAVFLMLLTMGFRPRWGMQITMIDVGQGDAILAGADGVWSLVDGGSSSRSQVGTYVIWPYLKSQGITRLDAVFVTHPDADHINGIEELLVLADGGGLRIGRLFLPEWMQEDEDGLRLCALARQAGASCTFLKRGDQIRQGKIRMTVLHPQAKERWEDPNSGSLVLSWEYGEIRGLFMGDLPSEEEKKLLALVEPCDFLKVGHHGSSGSSSEEFLAGADPEAALISCGLDNRYGHPGWEAVKRLEAQGCALFRTDTMGAVTLTARKGKLCVSCFRAPGLWRMR